MTNQKRTYWITILIAVLVLVSLACGSTAKELADALPTQAEAQVEVEEAAPASEEPAQPEPTDAPAIVEVQEEPLILQQSGFAQVDNVVGYAFYVENPNQGLAIESTEYQIAFYNDQDVVVDTESGYIELIAPGQKLGVASETYLDDGLNVSRIEIQLMDGTANPSEPLPDFEVTNTTYVPDEYFPTVYGLITNPYTKDMTTLRVSAVLLNDAGEIIGGGYTYINFLLAEQSTGVEISVTGSAEPASVEVYASLSGLSWLTDSEAMPADAQPLVLTKTGIAMGDYSGSYGMIYENPNGGYAVEDSQYRITFYDANGIVVETEEGYVDVVLPSQVIGVAGDLYFGDVIFDRAEFQFLPGSYEQSAVVDTFTTQNVNYLEGEYSSSVTGEITSPYAKDITYVKVYVIGLNGAGEIVGGGYTYLDFVPAGGSSAFDVSVTFSETPTEVQAYGVVSSLSDIE